MDPMGLVAPLRFKTLDSHPEKSNMGQASTEFSDFVIFQKSSDDSLTRYLYRFRHGAPKKRSSSFSVGTKKMCSEKLCRFVVVSPRELPSLTFSCPFKILVFRSFLKVPPPCLSLPSRKSVH